ncbi:hypothetical protein BHE90_016382 [Fusarium euwallaceae]|uniref:Uncharacterized protein n=1 Tax=Fusarium euwallaceae TaxID=1147111 RepID=A0A430L0M1_9HYPO|nr:hypothetical protein BHE90_016382 [Fusarium euwallaceae]
MTRHDVSARRTNLSNPPPKKARAPAPVRTLRTSSSDFPDLNADGLEYLDLTNDAFDDSDSLSFSSNAKLWREDYASRPNLVASSGRKRKSSEISEEEFSDLGDFPDIYELLERDLAVIEHAEPAMASKTICQPRFHPSARRTTMTYYHPMYTVRLLGATRPLKESAVSSEASNPVHQTSSFPPRMEDGRDEPFSPDSGEESLAPPSHNSSIAILKVSTNKPAQICTHAAPAAVPAVQLDFASPSQRHTALGIATPRVRAIASNSSQTTKITPEDSFNEPPSKTPPESSQALVLLNQLSSQPSIFVIGYPDFNYNKEHISNTP